MSKERVRGSNGGNARKAKLPQERRSEIAREAAKKRWAKAPDIATITTVPSQAESIIVRVPSMLESPVGDNGAKHCPACAMGQSLEKGEGTHILLTVEHPYDPGPAQVLHDAPIQAPTAPQIQRKQRPKPIPKAFKGASSYAEKRLAEALKERAEYMGRVAALNAEIPSLVQVIRALGTSTIPPEAMQAYPPMMPDYNGPSRMPGQYQPNSTDPTQSVPGIDPALFHANSGPVPRIGSSTPPAAFIPGEMVGGTTDLDYDPNGG